jgi:hypothetical protein
MTQSKRMSLVEAATNTLVGIVLAVGTQLVVFGLYGLDVDLSENVGIAAAFLVVSLIRTYVLRRAFAGAWKRPVPERRTRWHDHRPAPPLAAPSRTSEVD